MASSLSLALIERASSLALAPVKRASSLALAVTRWGSLEVRTGVTLNEWVWILPIVKCLWGAVNVQGVYLRRGINIEKKGSE